MKKASRLDELATAYELLLGAPLSRFDAGAYATYVWSDYLSGELAWTAATLKKMTKPVAPRSAKKGDLASPRGIDWDRFDLDLAQSLFLIRDVGAAAKKVLAPLVRGAPGLSGRSLAAALTAKKLGPKALADEQGEFFIPMVGRVVTDGTLRDAMSAATWTASAPKGLLRPEPGGEVDPAWARTLGALADPKVRAHFGCLCQTPNAARSGGARFLSKRCSREPVAGCGSGRAWLAGDRSRASRRRSRPRASRTLFLELDDVLRDGELLLRARELRLQLGDARVLVVALRLSARLLRLQPFATPELELLPPRDEMRAVDAMPTEHLAELAARAGISLFQDAKLLSGSERPARALLRWRHGLTRRAVLCVLGLGRRHRQIMAPRTSAREGDVGRRDGHRETDLPGPASQMIRGGRCLTSRWQRGNGPLGWSLRTVLCLDGERCGSRTFVNAWTAAS